MEAPVILAVAAILTPVGGAFGFLINKIVSTSETAVKELRNTNQEREKKLERERDEARDEAELWKERALISGWRQTQ